MPIGNKVINELWSFTISEKFNVAAVHKLFGYPGLSLVVAGEDGVVRLYTLPQKSEVKEHHKPLPIKTLETKGGPIQCIEVHDVTKFYEKDVLVADSKGTVTVFCNEQILLRKAFSEKCINCLTVQHDSLQNFAIIVSDKDGHITAFTPHADLWRIRISDFKHLKGLGKAAYIQCMLPIEHTNSAGQRSFYLLAADNCKNLYVIHQGSLVQRIQTPAQITAMCTGRFVRASDIEGVQSSLVTNQQVALGSSSGAIYIMDNLEVYLDEFANVNLPLGHLSSWSAGTNQEIDYMLCAGNFNSLIVLYDGKEKSRFTTASWINTLHPVDIDGDEQKEVVFGCLDNSIHAVKLHLSGS